MQHIIHNHERQLLTGELEAEIMDRPVQICRYCDKEVSDTSLKVRIVQILLGKRMSKKFNRYTSRPSTHMLATSAARIFRQTKSEPLSVKTAAPLRSRLS